MIRSQSRIDPSVLLVVWVAIALDANGFTNNTVVLIASNVITVASRLRFGST